MIPIDFQKYIRSKAFKDLLDRYCQCQDKGEKLYFDADDILDIAEFYHLKNEPEKALKAAAYCLELFPDNLKAKVFISRTHILQGDLCTAQKVADSITEGTNLDVIYLRAELMLCHNDVDKAEKYLQSILNDINEGIVDMEYDDVEDCIPKAEFALDVVLLYCDYMQWDIAKRWLEKASKYGIDENSADFIEAAARICTANGEYDRGIALWNKYIDVDAYSYMAWIQLAQCQFQKGMCSDALTSAQYAESINPLLPEAYISQGNSLYSLGRYEESLEKMLLFLELVPDDIQAEFLIATTLFSLEKYEESSRHIEKAISLIEQNNGYEEQNLSDYVCCEIYRQAAYIYGALHKLDDAFTCADKLVLYGTPEIKVKLLRAAVMIEAEQIKEAFEEINEIICNSSHDPEIYIMVGCILVDSSLYTAGYTMLKDTLKILEESGEKAKHGYDRLSFAALATDHYDEFIKALEVSVNLQPFETVTIFSSYFPENMPVSQYVEYAKENKIKFNQ